MVMRFSIAAKIITKLKRLTGHIAVLSHGLY